MQLSYDDAVRYLTEKPEEIYEAWKLTGAHPAGLLFSFAKPRDIYGLQRPDGKWCGCLTMIRGGGIEQAWTDEVTVAIKSDARLPVDPRIVTADHLPIFAAWQKYLDFAIRGVPASETEFCPIVLGFARAAGAPVPEAKQLPAVVLDAVDGSLRFRAASVCEVAK